MKGFVVVVRGRSRAVGGREWFVGRMLEKLGANVRH